MSDDGAERLGERLLAAGARIRPVLEELLPRGEQDYLSEPVWHHLETGGKLIRPAICLLACECLGGRADDALHFAAAVELMHNMLLIHDDLEDGDTVRRDRETVWVKYGVANGVNVGDFLLGVAYTAVLKSPVPDATRVRLVQAFTRAYEATCRGQALDINLRGCDVMSVDDYLHLVTLKTGRYLALGMVGGGIIAGCGDEVTAAFDELGVSMGSAFQIRDDVIDLTAGKGRGGVLGNDIREGKSSILYAHAVNAAGPEERAELIAIMGRPREETTDEDVARVREIYDAAGSIEFAQAEAERLVVQAFETIERLPVEEKDFFRDLTRFMVSRKT